MRTTCIPVRDDFHLNNSEVGTASGCTCATKLNCLNDIRVISKFGRIWQICNHENYEPPVLSDIERCPNKPIVYIGGSCPEAYLPTDQKIQLKINKNKTILKLYVHGPLRGT